MGSQQAEGSGLEMTSLQLVGPQKPDCACTLASGGTDTQTHPVTHIETQTQSHADTQKYTDPQSHTYTPSHKHKYVYTQ